MFTGKSGLKMFHCRDRFPNLRGLPQALLATAAQLETLHLPNHSFLDEYWDLVHQLPDHPLKTVTRLRLETHFLSVDFFQTIMDVCPNVKFISNHPFSFLLFDVVQTFFDRYSRRAGDVRQLVMEAPCSDDPQFRNNIFQYFVDESAQLPDCVVMVHLDEVPPEIVICRQNAIIHIQK